MFTYVNNFILLMEYVKIFWWKYTIMYYKIWICKYISMFILYINTMYVGLQKSLFKIISFYLQLWEKLAAFLLFQLCENFFKVILNLKINFIKNNNCYNVILYSCYNTFFCIIICNQLYKPYSTQSLFLFIISVNFFLVLYSY